MSNARRLGLAVRGAGHLQMELSPAGAWATDTSIICCLQFLMEVTRQKGALLKEGWPAKVFETMWLVRGESELDLI